MPFFFFLTTANGLIWFLGKGTKMGNFSGMLDVDGSLCGLRTVSTAGLVLYLELEALLLAARWQEGG